METSWFYFYKTPMDVSAVKTQELLSCFSKLQGAVIIHPCPVCEPRGIIWKEDWNHLPCLCMPLQLAVQELPAVLQLFRPWAENAHLTELKQNCREDPATEAIHQWEQYCSCPLQAELWALRSGWILSKAVNPPFLPFACGGSHCPAPSRACRS